MPSTTTNLGLTVYSSGSADQWSGSFITWQQAMSGSANSNMTKIDEYAGFISGSVTSLISNTSGSMTDISGSIASISGSLTALTATVTALGLRFQKLAEFSGSGQANFTNISQDYTHLLIVGEANSVYNGATATLAMDFNADANSSNYLSLQWVRQFSLVDSEYFSNYERGCIYLGDIPAYLSRDGTTYYGGTFLGLIPNYAASGGFYKTGMGISQYSYLTNFSSAGLQGGVWKSSVPITQIRVFSIYSSSLRLDFQVGTKITLYGLG